MKNKAISTIFLALLLSVSSTAQIAMGKWKTYLAYNSVDQIVQSDNKIFAVSDGALYSVDKQDGSIEFYNKVTGLNGSDIARVGYYSIGKQLLLLYKNGNIDFLSGNGVANLPDLYNKQMSASKEVNDIYFYQNRAYLSCNFGIVVLNMQKKEIAETYYIGSNASEVQVLNTVVSNENIYALTPTAIYKASVNEPNLVNYEYWSTISNLPGNGTFQSIGSFGGKLLLLRGNQLYKQDQNGWTILFSNINNFTTSNGKLLANDGNNNLYVVDTQFNYETIQNMGKISAAEYDSQNNLYWLAANSSGVVSCKSNSSGTPELSFFKPSGPAVNSPYNMTFAGKKLFVVQGGRGAAQYGLDGIVMMHENNQWKNILRKEIEDSTKHSVLDFMNIAVDPEDATHFFITSYGTGLYEFKNNTFFKWYNYLNSTISTVIPENPYNYMRLDGAIFDKQKNLFMVNEFGGKAVEINILLADGSWKKLSYIFNSVKMTVIPTMGRILISNQNPNQKWIPSFRYNPGICVFDDNGTLTDQSDDKSIFIESFIYPETDAAGKTYMEVVSPSLVYSLAQDKNGVIWIGTDKGPFLFQNLSKVFNSDYTCSRVKIPRNDGTDQADYLLADQDITAIAIDGANRKWLGTKSSGVYLMSENGQETIKHFTSSNSPLLSNNILSIAINPITGEVFFGTSQGLISYQSDAAEAGSAFTNVHAYPNPVRENFSGLITITGLVENTQVKITDINGNLVCQTISNGSIATWDGKDVHGRKVSSGVYMAMCTSSDGTQSAITKILIIN